MAADTGFTQKKTFEVLTVLLNTLTETLKKGDSITIRGFGKFHLIRRNEVKTRHPRTGQQIIIADQNIAKFKASKSLKEKMNGFDLDDFKEQNAIILQQLYNLCEESLDYEEEHEEYLEVEPPLRMAAKQLLPAILGCSCFYIINTGLNLQ